MWCAFVEYLSAEVKLDALAHVYAPRSAQHVAM